MPARDLVRDFPSVRGETPALEVARLMAVDSLPGLVVVDGHRRTTTVLLGTDVVKTAVPSYCLSDPALPRVVEEAAADVVVGDLWGRTVAEVLPGVLRGLPVVDGDATAVEIAVLMGRAHSRRVAVVGEDGALDGAGTLDGLLDRGPAS